jgi:hypothetical protein
MDTLCQSTFATDSKVEELNMFARSGGWSASFVAPEAPSLSRQSDPVSPYQDEYDFGGYAGI